MMGGIYAKKQNTTKWGTELNMNRDKISELPDCLLHNIISLIPTKEAVKTSVLAKRWRNLWTSVSKLDLRCFNQYWKDYLGKIERTEKQKTDTFIRFVNKVLQFHCSNIKIFNLSFDETLDNLYVESWISAAVERHVEELSLSIFTAKPLMLPQSLCHSESVTILRINLRQMGDLKLPESVCLPQLKTLQLVSVTFLDKALTEKLFISLPMLEVLEISNCHWKDTKSVTISIPSVKRLTLYIVSHMYDHKACEIKVLAENLIHLNCVTQCSDDLLLEGLSSLVDAYIDFEYAGDVMDLLVASYATNLFSAVRSTKSLSLGQDVFEGICDITKECSAEILLPTFGNLTDLEIDAALRPHTSDTFKNFLRNSPLLKTLNIKKQVEGGTWLRKESSSFVMSPLRTCSLWSFSGQTPEMSFVKFILKNSTGLERIKVYCSKFLTGKKERLQAIRNQLEMSPRASQRCEIEFLLGFA